MAEVIIYEYSGRLRGRTILSRRRNFCLHEIQNLEDKFTTSPDPPDQILLDKYNYLRWEVYQIEQALDGTIPIVVMVYYD